MSLEEIDITDLERNMKKDDKGRLYWLGKRIITSDFTAADFIRLYMPIIISIISLLVVIIVNFQQIKINMFGDPPSTTSPPPKAKSAKGS